MKFHWINCLAAFAWGSILAFLLYFSFFSYLTREQLAAGIGIILATLWIIGGLTVFFVRQYEERNGIGIDDTKLGEDNDRTR